MDKIHVQLNICWIHNSTHKPDSGNTLSKNNYFATAKQKQQLKFSSVASSTKKTMHPSRRFAGKRENKMLHY